MAQKKRDEEIKEEEVVVDGEIAVGTGDPAIIEEPLEIVVRVKTLLKTEEPPLEGFFYGQVLENGLREVLQRTTRQSKNGIKYDNMLMWYERDIVVNGEQRILAYPMVHAPSLHELFDEYFYCTTQWNVSKKTRVAQDNEPGWKRMVVMQDATRPYVVRGSNLRAFHFVSINDSYIPIEGPGGRKIDGMFVQNPPFSGTYIKSYRNALQILGGSPFNQVRQRVADDSQLAVSASV